MTHRILVLLFILIISQTHSQGQYNSKSLVVSTADLKNVTYQKDTTANAFFIYEKGFSRVENGGSYNLLTDYEAKVKILNKNGFDQATIEIQLYNQKGYKEYFKKLVAFTHNLENGKVVKTPVENSQVFKNKYNENITLVKFTFPNVKPGSVITYKYQIESPFMYNFNGWQFQDDIPKAYSEFTADLPGNYVYNIKLIGTLKLDQEETSIKKRCLEIIGYGEADCAHSLYTMKDIPAFKEEEYMTTKNNYLSRVEYTLKEFKGYDGINKRYTKTWKSATEKLKTLPTIGLQLKKTGLTKDILPDEISSQSKNLEKAKAIYRHITQVYKWNGNYRIFKENEESKLKKVIDNKTGNVSGINILLHNTLKQQGFTVKPILLSTRDNGYATTVHPVIYDFNYLITQLEIDGTQYLLDATENLLAFGELPFRCLNQYGRLLDFKTESSWINIKPIKRSTYFFKEELTLNTDHELLGTASYFFSGYHGFDRRKEFDQVNTEEYYDKIKKNNLELSVSEVQIKNEDNPDKPFEEHIKFTTTTEEIDGLLYINLFTRPFFKKNPFNLDQRTYPVDFGHKNSYTYTISLEIPEGYDFVDIPKSKKYALPNNLGSMLITTTTNNKLVMLSHRVVLNSSYYSTKYYDSLKELFGFIVQIENDTFITVKKKS